MAENGKPQRGKTLFSKRVPGTGRSYFIDVRQSEKNGNKYLVLTESKQVDGGWKRESVFVFPDRASDWKQTFEEAYTYL